MVGHGLSTARLAPRRPCRDHRGDTDRRRPIESRPPSRPGTTSLPPTRHPALAGLLVLLLAIGACAPRQSVAPTDAGRYRITRDIAYAEGNPRFTLDLYRPVDPPGQPPPRRPLLVYLYGGLWTIGDKEEPMASAIPEDLAARGAIVAVPNYRLWPEVTFPAFLDDAARAVAWAEQHAAEYGGDPRAVFLAGHSTGATMAMLLALDRRYLDGAGASPGVPAAVIGLSGVYEPWLFEHRVMRPIFGPAPDRQRTMAANNLRPGMPPALLLAGGWDWTVEPRNSTDLAAAIRGAGGEAEARLYPGIGHLDILMAGLRMPSFAPTADDMADFIRRHAAAPLQNSSPAPQMASQQQPRMTEPGR